MPLELVVLATRMFFCAAAVMEQSAGIADEYLTLSEAGCMPRNGARDNNI